MHSKNYNIQFMIYDKANEVTEVLFEQFLIDIKLDWKYQRVVGISSLILFIYCFKKNKSKLRWIIYRLSWLDEE